MPETEGLAHPAQAKGFPDLATRRFLSILHTAQPELELFALVDFDPHGVAIMRTYKYGSRRLGHEGNATVPRLRWLGILSNDVLRNEPADNHDTHDESQGSDSLDDSSQESVAYSVGDSEHR
jgi:meiotic recombination protein SPO11